jgi:hypothetical protein
MPSSPTYNNDTEVQNITTNEYQNLANEYNNLKHKLLEMQNLVVQSNSDYECEKRERLEIEHKYNALLMSKDTVTASKISTSSTTRPAPNPSHVSMPSNASAATVISENTTDDSDSQYNEPHLLPPVHNVITSTYPSPILKNEQNEENLQYFANSIKPTNSNEKRVTGLLDYGIVILCIIIDYL